jgi:serine protein kinase
MPESKTSLSSLIQRFQNTAYYRELNWEGSFEDYLEIVQDNPRVTRTAFQRVYDMIRSCGKEEYTEYQRKIIRYNFFKDLPGNGKDAVYGLDIHLSKMVDIFKAAAQCYGTERRVLLLHGPVGSSKSTIVRLLKKGLEEYSKTAEGALYTYAWVNLPIHEDRESLRLSGEMPCPMHEEPLHLIPIEIRESFLEELNRTIPGDFKVQIEGDLCPACRQTNRELGRKYNGDWPQVLSHVRVRRLILSEKDRIGVGTFQPKDEKKQDSTELTGDINYRKIAVYGSDSDARAFNFDGEFNIANRGIIEFIEVLKLDAAFLYDLLGASQEHKIKPKKFPQTDIDEVIIGHTNEPEYRKLQNNEFMEALRDRTVKIDVPYITKLSEEIKIYAKDFNPHKIAGKHIAPHTIEMAAMWAVLTRLEEPKTASLTLLQKLKLYDGKTLTGFTEDSIKELREEAVREGMDGISPRYVQDKISNALVSNELISCVNPFLVLNELESGLKHHSLIKGDEQRKRYKELLAVVKQEYEDIVKDEVQRAISADEDAISRLGSNYIDNIKADTERKEVRNKYTGQDEEPDERLMRSVEEKIDVVKSRMIKNYQYCDICATDVLNYVASIFARGDSKRQSR